MDSLGFSVDRMLDGGPKNSMLAVLAPGLGDDFEFHVGGLASPVRVDFLHRQHVLATERQLHESAQLEQLIAVQRRDFQSAIVIRRGFRDLFEEVRHGWVR